MKKLITLLLTVCMLLAALASCGRHEHAFGTEWSKDATHHWLACEGEECVEVIDKAEHTWGDAVVTEAKEKRFTCTVCGQTKTEAIKTTMTADEWSAAFDLGTNWTLSLYATHSAENQAATLLVERDGDKFRSKETLKDTDTGEEESFEDYDEIVGTQWYRYQYDSDLKAFEKTLAGGTAEEQLAETMALYLPAFLKNMDSFTYDEAKKAYVAAELTGEEAKTIKNLEISFEDGKLVAFSYEIAMKDALVTYAYTIAYGNTSVTLPTIDDTKNTYKVIISDSNGDLVKGVRVQACKGDLCLAPVLTNERGVAVIRLDKTENVLDYHVKIAKFPAGYTGDTNAEYSFEAYENELYIFIDAPAE